MVYFPIQTHRNTLIGNWHYELIPNYYSNIQKRLGRHETIKRYLGEKKW